MGISEIDTPSLSVGNPQTLPGLLSNGTASLSFAPPFLRKQVPPFSRVQTKFVQPSVAAHLPPQYSPCITKGINLMYTRVDNEYGALFIVPK